MTTLAKIARLSWAKQFTLGTLIIFLATLLVLSPMVALECR